MATVRRYGPALVSPQVSPRAELGRGREQTFKAFQDIFDGANQFIRPAVEEIQTRRGQQEALEAVERTGPNWQLSTSQEAPTKISLGGSQPTLAPGPTRVRAAIKRAAETHGVDPGALTVIGILESGLNPNAQNKGSSAGGLMQFIDSTAEQYGVADRFDVDQAADGGARIMRDAGSRLGPFLGRAPTVGELYLAHQQGLQGAIDLLSAPAPALASSIVGRDAVALNGGDPDTMTARAFANLWIDKANEVARKEGIAVSVPGAISSELELVNGSTFEPRLPFTVRDAAFNSAADRVISSRASAAMEEGIRAAMQSANGDLGKLREGLEEARRTVMAGLPQDMPGLAVDLQSQFERGKAVAERQAVELAQKRVAQGQADALSQVVVNTQQEAQRLALTGAGPQELADHMAQATDALAQYGPREGFEIAGRVYPPDPSRLGTMTADAIASSMAEISMGARQLMIEADFERSSAQGQYVEEFRRQVFAGNSPLPPGESLDLLRRMETRARTNESARRSVAEVERRRLEKEMGETINAYVSLTEAGVPVAIPEAERQRILASLSPYPDLQRKAKIEFEVADAQVATHGMTGPELIEYATSVRSDIAAAAERGEIDLEGAAVIESLQDRLKAIQDAVNAEVLGLPMIEQLVKNGGSVDQVDYEALRLMAGKDADLLREISEVEQFHKDVETLSGMTAAEREMVLEDARASLAVLAARGDEFGAQALTSQRVVERLEEWSAHRTKLAESDPIKYAKSIGLDLPSFEGVQTIEDAGKVISDRVNMLAPRTAGEGVKYPVPLSQSELDGISEAFQNSTRQQRAAFLGSIADLGQEQATAIFERIGKTEPALYAAGAVYSMGNQKAAGIILRGAVDTKLGGGTKDMIAQARESALYELLEEDMIAPEGFETLDAAALAYARGLAMAEGGRDIEADDLEEGYSIALGRQEDGTGGLVSTRYGATLAPSGWDARRINRAIRSIDDQQLSRIAGGNVVDRFGREFSADDLRGTIESLRPSPEDPNILVPLDADGAVFLTDKEGQRGILQFDLREIEN